MSFESVKYDTIQRIAKKFSKINEENKNELLDDIQKYNFSKILDEIIKYILESKYEFKEINAIVLILSELNQIYENFHKKLFDGLKKTIKDFLDTIAKTPAKNEEDEEKRVTRKKALFRLAIESFLYGLFTDFNYIKDILIQLISLKSNLFQDFPILISLMKIFAEQIFSIKSTSVKKLIEDGDIQDYELNSHLSHAQSEKYIDGFSSFYKKRVLPVLAEEHKNLIELEKKNYENLKKLDSNIEIQLEYQKKRQIFTKLLKLIKSFAEIMDFEPPELSEDKIIRIEESKKMETVNNFFLNIFFKETRKNK